MTIKINDRPVSWNTHALLTRAALRGMEANYTNGRFTVRPLEDFLAAEEPSVLMITRWYRNLIGRKTGRKPIEDELPNEIRTVEQFYRALWLNCPETPAYVRVLRPEEVSSSTGHDASRAGPPGSVYTETPLGEQTEGKDILATYSDEPDWGMDQDLFSVEDFRYGPCPFGPKTGESSQAPFHMAFLHESTILTWAVPGLKRSFAEERIRLFFALARLALNTGYRYWGLRFTAWGMHYLQDLTQPYHAKAFPFPLFRVLFRAVRDGGFVRSSNKNKNLLRNRHMLYEAAVHYVFNDAVKKWVNHPFVMAASGDGSAPGGTLRWVMREATAASSGMAVTVDRAIMELMDDPNMTDPAYYLGDDHSYRIDEETARAASERPTEFEQFLESTCEALTEAGRVTRFCVNRMDLDKGAKILMNV